ncbi:hypothetical protein TREMEDRAFT_57085 [Tremella mesenterica DSM 1558]|uniref:uncharacterized protein n=1 Tax=Tremella mesenterica (strain ATCC 24925 / CBS 8224 / DSM 1558 / NBRC 9311 / NRRL Y-6157 / RJB 2259-6 / UBC 559-6) TaxID=578456 RepID=UPI0003F48E90|nr:uncharacterized protein TREMEDRAFT_57085 [Tremella mesenterica DSM 1558]EIW69079.1 hypothetical protein TREMEDRAFT_57085 [Tremella mesenterica DSM 1558]
MLPSIILLSLTALSAFAIPAPDPEPAQVPGHQLRQATRDSVISALKREALGLKRRQTTAAPYPTCPNEQGQDSAHPFPAAVYLNTLGTYNEEFSVVGTAMSATLDECLETCRSTTGCVSINYNPNNNPTCSLLNTMETNLQAYMGVTYGVVGTDCASNAVNSNNQACCNVYSDTA